AVPNRAGVVVAADADVSVIVAPGGVQSPADLTGSIGHDHLALGPDLLPAGVLGHHDRLRSAIDDIRDTQLASDELPVLVHDRDVVVAATQGADVAARALRCTTPGEVAMQSPHRTIIRCSEEHRAVVLAGRLLKIGT